MALDEMLWCERGILVSVRDFNGNLTTVQVDKPFARIGTDYRSDVVLEEGDVPSRAVYLHATDDGVYYRRLVPRERGDAPSSGWLSPDRFIQIGDYTLAASLTGSDESVNHSRLDLRRRRYSADEAPRIRIQRVGLKGPAVEHCCRRPFTIVGRSNPSAIRLKRPMVSRCHCVLFWDGRELWAVDLLSANGTLLDGRPVEGQRVLPGQVLQLGEIQITYLGVGAKRTPEEFIAPAEAGPILPADVSEVSRHEIAQPLTKEHADEKLLAENAGWLAAPAASAGEAVSLECAAEGDDSELSSIALEMSLYACEEQSASGQTISGAISARILKDVEAAERGKFGRNQRELTARLQQLEAQRDELLQQVSTISTHLQELRRESQLKADGLRKRCRRLKRQLHRNQGLLPES
jgi:pSer/pThr/pTyr-binding forkhead associated (FHA) protein